MLQLAMQDFIETQNIASFKTRLENETDPVTRATLIRLLMQEEAKHAAGIVAAGNA